MIPQGVYLSDAKDLHEIRPGSPPTRAPNADKKVKFSHTGYQALGPELIPVYRQSARR